MRYDDFLRSGDIVVQCTDGLHGSVTESEIKDLVSRMPPSAACQQLSQLAEKTGAHTTQIKPVTIWGNHSSTQYPDLHHATVAGKPALSLVQENWYKETFIPTVQQRGAASINARGASSAASAALVRGWPTRRRPRRSPSDTPSPAPAAYR